MKINGHFRVCAEKLGYYDDEIPLDLIIRNYPDEPPRMVCAGPGQGKTAFLVSSMVHEFGQMFVCQLGAFQEYQQELLYELRSAAQQESELLDLFDPAGANAVAATILADLANDDPPATIDVSSPSLELPWDQTPLFLPTAYDVFCTVVADGVCDAVRWAFECEQVLRALGAAVAVLRKAVQFIVPFFCSVRWERRRWFLHHGARPPKQTAQAILGLFAGACSSPTVAY